VDYKGNPPLQNLKLDTTDATGHDITCAPHPLTADYILVYIATPLYSAENLLG
jgi:hypothetical protein